MAEPKDKFETVKLEGGLVEEARRFRERDIAGDTEDRPHDGRFGERFDDELHVSGIVWVTFSIAAVTALFFLISWGVIVWLAGEREAAAAPMTPVAAEHQERRLPGGPRLQSSPEAELRELRREMHDELHGYGWVDEAAGVVRIPVEKAIELVLEEGLASAGETAAPAAEEAAEPPEARASGEEGAR